MRSRTGNLLRIARNEKNSFRSVHLAARPSWQMEFTNDCPRLKKFSLSSQCIQSHAIWSKLAFILAEDSHKFCIYYLKICRLLTLLQLAACSIHCKFLRYYTINYNCSKGQYCKDCTILSETVQYYIFTLHATRRLYLILASRSFSFHYGKDDTNVTSFTLMRPRRWLILFTLDLSLSAVHFFLVYFLFLLSLSRIFSSPSSRSLRFSPNTTWPKYRKKKTFLQIQSIYDPATSATNLRMTRAFPFCSFTLGRSVCDKNRVYTFN